MRKRSVIVLGLLGLLCCLFYLLAIHSGLSHLLVQTAIRYRFKPEIISYAAYEGDLLRGMLYKEMSLKNVASFVTPNRIDIQELGIGLRGLGGIYASVYNGRLKSGRNEAMVINGIYERGRLNGTLFFNTLLVEELIPQFAENEFIGRFQPLFADGEFAAQGPLRDLSLSGMCTLKTARDKHVAVRDLRFGTELRLKRKDDSVSPLGVIRLHSGTVRIIDKTDLIITKSLITFSGDYMKPRLDVRGSARVGNIDIDITVTGMPPDVDFSLASDPPRPEKFLLIMIATGQEWKGVDTLYKDEEVTADLAIDFIDFLLFGGSIGTLLDKTGIKDIEFEKSEEKTKVGVVKQITPGTDVSYEVTTEEGGGEKKVSQKLGAEYSLTDNIAIEGKKGLSENEEGKTDDEILLKLKKRF